MTFLKTSEVEYWLNQRRESSNPSITQIPLTQVSKWSWNKTSDYFSHESGMFFKICGTETTISGNTIYQPIILQPEIGILGILAKKFDGVLHFLMQAKIEPGNVNAIQLSPTVQATKSNYTQIHKGSKTKYIEFFQDRSKGIILSDQLQSEQNSFFYMKKNRNIILETTQEVEIHPDFCWLTMAQLKKLMRIKNLVNMDSRTVLASFRENSEVKENPIFSMTDLLSWFTEAKARLEIQVKLVGLSSLKNWNMDSGDISKSDHTYFSVTGVSFEAKSREIANWMQPLIKPNAQGLNVFFVKAFNGIPHFLVQAKVEPGCMDGMELGPSVQFLPESPWNFITPENSQWSNIATSASSPRILFDTIQSEEGGRFYHYQNRNMIVQIQDELGAIPADYTWMTLNQMQTALCFSNLFNLEARSLIACYEAVTK